VALFANGSLDQAPAPERSGALKSTARAEIAVGGAMHRDLKPSNILPEMARRPVITDLGSGRGLGAGMAQRVRTMSAPAPEVQLRLVPFELLTRVRPLRLSLTPCAHRAAQREIKLRGSDSGRQRGDPVLIELQRRAELVPVE
jgi:serine/threonine protein kinase